MEEITGLHHVTLLSTDARRTDGFYTGTLGLRRVKTTVNFDAPDIYHLYYGDEIGTPGTVATFFPFPDAAPGRPGAGVASVTSLAIPEGAAPFWADRLDAPSGPGTFGGRAVHAAGPDGERLDLIEVAGDDRVPWTGGGIAADHAIRGLAGITLTLADAEPTQALLELMGYRVAERAGAAVRMIGPGHTAQVIDLDMATDVSQARQGAGSVHHVAFRVADRAAQDRVRGTLTKAGFPTTPPIDRDYFHAIYFHSPGGVLFEIATDDPGFTRDEDRATLGETLQLPDQHAHLRDWITGNLPPLT